MHLLRISRARPAEIARLVTCDAANGGASLSGVRILSGHRSRKRTRGARGGESAPIGRGVVLAVARRQLLLRAAIWWGGPLGRSTTRSGGQRLERPPRTARATGGMRSRRGASADTRAAASTGSCAAVNTGNCVEVALALAQTDAGHDCRHNDSGRIDVVFDAGVDAEVSTSASTSVSPQRRHFVFVLAHHGPQMSDVRWLHVCDFGSVKDEEHCTRRASSATTSNQCPRCRLTWTD